MTRRPDFLRESIWAQLDDAERRSIHDAVTGAEELAARLEKSQADVAMHRRLARKFADQARTLLESMRDRPDSHGSPPSVVRRVEKLVDDLDHTAGSGPPRQVVPHGEIPDVRVREVAAYSPPAELPAARTIAPTVATAPNEPYRGPDEMEDEEREPTQVGAVARVRSNVKREHTLRPDTLQSYEGDLEVIEDLEDLS